MPGTGETMPFYLLRSTGQKLRIATLLEPGSTPAITELQVTESGAEVQFGSVVERHISTVEGWEVRSERETIRLRGSRKAAAPFQPLMQNHPLVARGVALQVAEAPAVDGSLDGFDTSEPLSSTTRISTVAVKSPIPALKNFLPARTSTGVTRVCTWG